MSALWRTHTTVILIAGILLIILASAIAFMVTTFQPRTAVSVGSATFSMRVADSQDELTLGLSGTPSMGKNEGLLMVFDRDAQWGIWMKDMDIALDIIWLNSQKEVVYIVTNAGPELSTTKTFQPEDPARYVLEVNAGQVAANGIKVGDVAEFELEAAEE